MFRSGKIKQGSRPRPEMTAWQHHIPDSTLMAARGTRWKAPTVNRNPLHIFRPVAGIRDLFGQKVADYSPKLDPFARRFGVPSPTIFKWPLPRNIIQGHTGGVK